MFVLFISGTIVRKKLWIMAKKMKIVLNYMQEFEDWCEECHLRIHFFFTSKKKNKLFWVCDNLTKWNKCFPKDMRSKRKL